MPSTIWRPNIKKFPRDGHRIHVIETNQICGVTLTKWFYRSTIQCSMTSQINHLFMKLWLLLEQPSFHFLDTCEDKWFDKRNAHTIIQSMILPRVKQLLYYSVCDVHWFSNSALPTCFDLFYHPRSNRYWHFPTQHLAFNLEDTRSLRFYMQQK